MEVILRGRRSMANLDLEDVLKGSKVVFCETVVIFDLGPDDPSVAGAALRMLRAHFSWQAQYFVDFNKIVLET